MRTVVALSFLIACGLSVARAADRYRFDPRELCTAGAVEEPMRLVLGTAGLYFKYKDQKLCADRFEVTRDQVALVGRVVMISKDRTAMRAERLTLDPMAADDFMQALAEAWERNRRG